MTIFENFFVHSANWYVWWLPVYSERNFCNDRPWQRGRHACLQEVPVLDWGCYGGHWGFHQINVYVIYMHKNFSWNFHQIFILTISFIVLNVSIDFVLIYRPHPVSRIVKAWLVLLHTMWVTHLCQNHYHKIFGKCWLCAGTIRRWDLVEKWEHLTGNAKIATVLQPVLNNWVLKSTNTTHTVGILQRRNTENSTQIFPEVKLCGLSPNFHIHVSSNNL